MLLQVWLGNRSRRRRCESLMMERLKNMFVPCRRASRPSSCRASSCPSRGSPAPWPGRRSPAGCPAPGCRGDGRRASPPPGDTRGSSGCRRCSPRSEEGETKV